jgi:hypothetical protein
VEGSFKTKIMENENIIQDINKTDDADKPSLSAAQNMQATPKRVFPRHLIAVFGILVAASLVMGILFINKKGALKARVRLNVIPEITTKEQVRRILGSPLQEGKGIFGEVYFYNFGGGNTQTLIFNEKGTVKFVGFTGNCEQVDSGKKFQSNYAALHCPVTKKEAKRVLGEDYYEFYRAEGDALYPVLVFPQKGAAFIYDPAAEKMLEGMYFAPTDIENFKTLYGRNLVEF